MAQKAEVKFDPAYLMASQIANRITELGYPATLLENETTGQGTAELTVIILCVLYIPARNGLATPSEIRTRKRRRFIGFLFHVCFCLV